MSRPAYSTSVLVDAASSELGLGSLFAAVTVGVAAVDVKVGASPLSGRTGVMIQADENNTGLIYLAVNGTPTTTNAMYQLGAGAGVVLTIDKYNIVPIKAISNLASQKIYITEIK